VRQITLADRADWERLYLAYLEFYETEPIESSTELVWSRLVNSEPEIQGLVVEDDGRIIGITHFHYQLSTWTHTWHCYLEDLYVEKRSRGKGAARALINEVKALATDKGCSELFWITRSMNETARKLYDKVANPTDFVRYEIMLEH
jgi:GNAT superfamily N-acetyltransferase